MARAINYTLGADSEHQHVQVTELIIDSGAVAQVSETPDGRGFLIRVWQPGGSVSDVGLDVAYDRADPRGHNLTNLSAVVSFDGTRPVVEEIRVNATDYIERDTHVVAEEGGDRGQ